MRLVCERLKTRRHDSWVTNETLAEDSSKTRSRILQRSRRKLPVQADFNQNAFVVKEKLTDFF